MTMTTDPLGDGWRAVLAPVLATPPLRSLDTWLAAEDATGKMIYPPRAQRLAAFALTPLEQVRVVIVGQDPYHGPEQAHGLAFSVRRGMRVPPSLGNIYKELASDLSIARVAHGHLEQWARRGVLLLNTALTVEQGLPGSHRNRGWERLTDAALAAVAARAVPCVFMLWGHHAQTSADRIPGLTDGPHLVLRAPHPSPLSARSGFFGCRHFSRANDFLTRHGRGAIDWTLPE